MQILGTAQIFIHVFPKTTDALATIILPILVDVVNSDAPMLISHESPMAAKASVGFLPTTLAIPSVAKIKLRSAKSGHLVIQGHRKDIDMGDGELLSQLFLKTARFT